MTTRLAHYCDRLIEAGWLAAAVLTPVFFNVYSNRVFEPDKLALLRSIAMVMAVAWLVRTLEGARGAGEASSPAGLWRALRATPLVPQVLLLVVVYVLATALSIVPRTSFWGSYPRLQGTYTTLAYIVIFFVAWQGLRTRAQLERLQNAIVLASLPVALYGMLQHYGLDPLPWAGDVQDRVTGNLGNAIFFSAYLILAFFVTLERVVARFRRLLGSEGSGLADAFMGAAYLFILALQLVAIYFSKSRGPWLGLLAGIYVFMLIALVALRRSAAARGPLTWAEVGKASAFALLSPLVGAIPAYLGCILAQRGRRWLWLSWCMQALLGIAFLVVFNLPQSPLLPLRQVPGLGRLGQVFETEGGTGRVRVLIWQGSVELLTSDPLRALVGYGPESMFVAFNPVYPPDLAHYESRTATPDRAHNETFDALITTGLIGFAVYIALFVGIFLHGLRWLGFLPGPNGPPGPRRLFLGLALGGAGLGALLPLLVDGSLRFAGVGIPVGLILGVALYLAVAAFGSPEGEGARARLGQRELLLASLLSLIVAHFVEIHFGIAIAATRLYFWLALALLISAGSGRLSRATAAEAPTPGSSAPAPARSRRRRRHSQRTPAAAPSPVPTLRTGGVAAGLLGALVLGTLLFAFTTNTLNDPNPARTLWNALTVLRFPDQSTAFSPGVLALLFLTWLLGAILVVSEGENAAIRPGRRDWLRALALYGGISLVGGLLFGLAHASQLRAERDLGLIAVYYSAFALAGLLLLAGALPGPRPGDAPLWRRGGRAAVLYPLLAGVLGLTAWSNASEVRADIYYKQAWEGLHRPATEALAAGAIDPATAQHYYDAALFYYDQALAWSPEQDYYLLFQGKAFLERAQVTADPQAQQHDLTRSEEALRRAQRLNPLNTDHTANLARLYRTWAQASADDATRERKLLDAARYYEQATRLSPRNAALYNEWGETLLDLNLPLEALARYQQALALDDRYAETHLRLAEYYLDRADPVKAAHYAAQAARVDPASLQVRAAVGYLYSRLGRPAEAIREYLEVVAVQPEHFVAQKNLAVLYQETGQPAKALEAARIARAVAPLAEQAALDQLIAQLEQEVASAPGAQP